MSDAEYYAEEEHEYPPEEESHASVLPQRRTRFDKWMAVSWGISLAVAGVILALAMVIVIFIKDAEDEDAGFELAVDQVLEDPEEQQKKVKEQQLEKSSSTTAPRTAITVNTNIADINIESVDFNISVDKGDVGEISGAGATGNIGLGMDLGSMSMVSFFGMKSQGNRFAFLIDYSASMKADQLKVMKHELVKTLTSFNRDVQVALIFFSGPAFIAGQDPREVRQHWDNPNRDFNNWIPKKGWKPPVPKWRACSPTNKAAFEKNVRGTPTSGGTDWRNPFNMAYTMSPAPQVIFFMTDGATRNPESTVEKVKRRNKIQVNSIAFGIPNAQAEEPMKEMAKATRGTFKSYSKAQIAKMAANL